MAEQITIAPAELRRAAEEHRRTAERLNDVTSTHAEIMASLESLGPVFSELRDAGRQLLEERRSCYQRQAAAHEELADTLLLTAEAWEDQDSGAARRIHLVHPDSE